jgi:hypothetical protein
MNRLLLSWQKKAIEDKASSSNSPDILEAMGLLAPFIPFFNAVP